MFHKLRVADQTLLFISGLYFAAKQGVAAKGGKETRPFLFAVLELLEKVRLLTRLVFSVIPGSC